MVYNVRNDILECHWYTHGEKERTAVTDFAARFNQKKRDLFAKYYGFLNPPQQEAVATVKGPLLVLAGAFLFACHIASLEFTSQKVNAQKLTFIQMAVASVMALGYAWVTNAATVTAEMLRTGALPVLYLGLFSTCICFFLQTWAQKHTSATKAAIFLSLEGVFGSLFSVILGLETMRWTLAVGGSLIFASVLLTEVRFGKAAK